MQAVMSSLDKYSRLSPENRGVIDQLIDFAFYRDHSTTTQTNTKNDKREEKNNAVYKSS